MPSIRITSLYGSYPSCAVVGCKTETYGLEWQVCMGSSRHVCGFFMQNTDFMTRLTILCGSQTSSVVLSTHTSVLSTRIKRLYGIQPSPVVLCMQNSGFSTWITSLYWSQPSSEVFACKPGTFGPKLHVSMGPRNHLWFSAWKTACLASEILVSMCPSPHLWLLHAKQRLYDQTYNSVWVPDLFCGFEHTYQRA